MELEEADEQNPDKSENEEEIEDLNQKAELEMENLFNTLEYGTREKDF